MIPFFRTTVLCVMLVIGFVNSLDAETYLIYNDLRELVIYNQYEQQLTFSEKNHIPACIPVRVIRDTLTLSDSYTRAMKVEIGDQFFFVLLNNDLSIKYGDKAQLILRLENAVVLDDTVEVIRENAAYFQAPQVGEDSYPLPVGTIILRTFEHSGRSYGQIADQNRFGWIRLKDRTAIIPFQKAEYTESGFSARDLNSIQAKITEWNRKIEQLFDFFNQKTSSNSVPPQWQISLSPEKIVCTLDRNTDAFLYSSEQLQKALTESLARYPLQIYGSVSAFTIEPDNGRKSD